MGSACRTFSSCIFTKRYKLDIQVDSFSFPHFYEWDSHSYSYHDSIFSSGILLSKVRLAGVSRFVFPADQTINRYKTGKVRYREARVILRVENFALRSPLCSGLIPFRRDGTFYLWISRRRDGPGAKNTLNPQLGLTATERWLVC